MKVEINTPEKRFKSAFIPITVYILLEQLMKLDGEEILARYMASQGFETANDMGF